MILGGYIMGLADGPSEVHKVTVARHVLRDYKPSPDLWPTEHRPKKVAYAKEKLAHYLDLEVGNM
jgi:acyl-CoA dehydrogenase